MVAVVNDKYEVIGNLIGCPDDITCDTHTNRPALFRIIVKVDKKSITLDLCHHCYLAFLKDHGGEVTKGMC